MSVFDDLNTVLGSLNIREVPNQTFETDEDDLMDIDSIESSEKDGEVLYEIESNSSGASKKNRVEMGRDVHDINKDYSFVSGILNPTTLGAKYALKPMKLLMPPPDFASSDLDDHDYEFSTSDMTKVDKSMQDLESTHALKQRTTSTHGRDQNYFSFGASVIQDPPFATGLSFTGNASQASVEHKLMPTSFQVHHHHYYAGPTYEHNRQNAMPGKNPTTDSGKGWPQIYQGQGQEPCHADDSKALHRLRQESGSMELLPGNPYKPEMLPRPWDPKAHPADRTPYILSSYLQLAINIVLSGYGLHVIIAMIQAIRQDVVHKMQQENTNLMVDIAQCERSYYENNCAPDTIVPALENICSRWEKCMKQDPSRLAIRSSVGAHTVGMIINSLIEPLSYKVLGVAAGAIVVVYVCNFTFGYVRAKSYYGWSSRCRQ